MGKKKGGKRLGDGVVVGDQYPYLHGWKSPVR